MVRERWAIHVGARWHFLQRRPELGSQIELVHLTKSSYDTPHQRTPLLKNERLKHPLYSSNRISIPWGKCGVIAPCRCSMGGVSVLEFCIVTFLFVRRGITMHPSQSLSSPACILELTTHSPHLSDSKRNVWPRAWPSAFLSKQKPSCQLSCTCTPGVVRGPRYQVKFGMIDSGGCSNVCP
jgi:hypothetical protein